MIEKHLILETYYYLCAEIKKPTYIIQPKKQHEEF